MTIVPRNDFTYDQVFWKKVPENYEGKIISLDNLEKEFPEIKVLEKEENRIIYGLEEKLFNLYIAYQCLKCNEIIFGPPKKQHFDNLSTVYLSGSVGSLVYCHNCNHY